MCGASRASKGPFRATHLRPTCFAGLMNTPTEPYSWAELAAIALHRQFPAADSVAELVEQVGPIQSQAARAPFLGIAARLTSADHASITAAYEQAAIVRGSTLRGTVHTSTAAVHPILDVLTRLGVGGRWTQLIRFQRSTPEELWRSIEEYAAPSWRTPDELRDHLAGWLTEHESPEVAAAAIATTAGRYLAFGHGALLRRPLKGGWEGQGAPGYRTAAAVLASQEAPGSREQWYAEPDRAVREAVRLHLRCHGPASRNDIAWWSGVGLRTIDAALAELAGELTTRTGPDGRVYHDLAELAAQTPASAPELPSVALLPEFDALLCGYEPSARTRFIDPEHHRRLWNQNNGLILAPLLVDGRITGYWRLAASGRSRALTAYWFAGTRRPGIAEVRRAAESVARALPVQLGEITVARHESKAE